MRKYYISILVCATILILSVSLAGCEKDDMLAGVSSGSSSASYLSEENFEPISSAGQSVPESSLSEENSSNVSAAQSLSPAVSSSADTSSQPQTTSAVSSGESSYAGDIPSLSLSTLQEFEDWITGKNEFSARHKENKAKINRNDGIFNRKVYYKLSDKITGFELKGLEFYYAQYSMEYKSEKLAILYQCIYGPEYNKQLLEDLERRKANYKKSTFSDVERNGILYTINIPNKEIAEISAVVVTWMYDDIFMTAYIYGQEYTPELLDYCIAQRVEL